MAHQALVGSTVSLITPPKMHCALESSQTLGYKELDGRGCQPFLRVYIKL